MNRWVIYGLACMMALLVSCNDDIHVQQNYGFDISTWFLPSAIDKDEPIEIRFYLSREGYFTNTEFSICYTQIEGQGEVFDLWDEFLTNREWRSLSSIPGLNDGTFTLYYRSTANDDSTIRFNIKDNFGNERELSISFQIRQ